MSETKAAKRTASSEGSELWSDEERAAAQETVKERKRQARRTPENERAEGEKDIRAKIAEMAEPDREMAERLHVLVMSTAPALVPRTFYGMPAYSLGGKVICFFQAASKFKVRYSTFGFQPDARIDDGEIWPVAFALTSLTPAAEAKIAALVKKAAG